MAAKKESEPKPPVVVEPTEATLTTLLDLCRADPRLGVPCLVGMTQGGKTTLVRRYAALTHGIEPDSPILKAGHYNHLNPAEIGLTIVNPQCDLPEDIAGWPKSSRGDEVHFTRPPILPTALFTSKKPWTLLIDELCKVQNDTISAMLSLFAERRLRETILPPHVFVMCAMNEPQRPLPDPLLARLLFIPYPTSVADLLGSFTLARHIAERLHGTLPVTKLPDRPVTRGATHKLELWMKRREFWEDPALKGLVVYGLYPPNVALAVLADLNDRPATPGVEWAAVVRPQDLKDQLPPVLSALSQEDRRKVMEELSTRSNNDASEEIATLLHEALSSVDVMSRVEPSPEHAAPSA